MKKQIALGIAAAVLGASGVAGAVVSVNQITALGSSESGLSVNHDQLAANCWLITGASSDADCNTSVAGIPVPGLPELPNLVDGVDIPDATGLLAMATGALGTVTDAAGGVQGIVGGGVPNAADLLGGAQGLAGVVPSACGLNLPVSLPTGIFSAGLNLFHMAQNLTMNDLGLAGVSSPVALPVSLPLSPDDVINKLETELGCVTGQGGALPVSVPAVCTFEAGAPAGVTSLIPGDVNAAIPGEISALISAAVADLTELSGQGVKLAEGGNVGVTCNIDGLLTHMPIPGLDTVIPPLPLPAAVLPVVPAAPLPSPLPALIPAAPLPSVPDVAGVVGTVTGVVDTVTSVVDNILGGALTVPNLPLPSSTPSCSGSATIVGSLLGSLTGTITGSCG